MGRRLTIFSLNFTPETSGIAPYSAELAHWLAERTSDNISVVTTRPHYPQWRPHSDYTGWRSNHREGNVRVSRLLHYIPRRPTNLRRLISETTFAIRAACLRWNKQDVVITVTPSLLATSAVVAKARLFGVPVVVWVQDLYSVGLSERNSKSATVGTRVLRSIERWVFLNASRVVVIHDRFRTHLEDDLKITTQRIEVIRNWTHIDTSRAAERSQIRKRFGWSNTIVIAHTGAQGQKQGLVKLVDSASQLERDFPEVVWLLVGNGSQRRQLEQAADGVSCVQIWDPLPEDAFLDLLAAVDAYLVCEAPGIAEAAVPSKLTTYFASPAPVVGVLNPNSISWAEISGARAGFLSPHDVSEMRKMLEVLVRRPDLRDEFGQNGQSFWKDQFDRSQCLIQFAKLLDNL